MQVFFVFLHKAKIWIIAIIIFNEKALQRSERKAADKCKCTWKLHPRRKASQVAPHEVG